MIFGESALCVIDEGMNEQMQSILDIIRNNNNNNNNNNITKLRIIETRTRTRSLTLA